MSKFNNAQAVKQALNRAKQLLRPPPNLKPSEWAEGQIRIPVGNAVPGLIRFANAPYQREPLDMLVDTECYRVTLQWAAQVGKALDIATPIPTPNGFVQMKDIKKGDLVFDEKGIPCTVLFATSAMIDRVCYQIIFDDGSEITCDADHIWHVVDRAHKIRGKATKRTINITVSEMLEGHERSMRQGRVRYSVKNTEPIEIDHKILPVDPYLYGVWLGDGNVFDGQVTFSRQDIEIAHNIEKLGHKTIIRYRDKRNVNTASCRVVCSDGIPLSAKLRLNGLRIKSKVNKEYIFSSKEQRLALLQGLMDTDGYVSKKGGAEFVSKQRILAETVATLAASLGMKPRLRQQQKSCLYKGERKTGTYYSVRFRAYADMNPFQLSRKANIVVESSGCFAYLRKSESKMRGIKAIIRVESRPVKCIQVDSKSRLYLAGKQFIPTHNTQLALCGQAYHIAMKPVSQMMMQPSQGDLQVWMNSKFNPMVDANQAIRDRLATPRGRDGVNNSTMKSYPGGFLMFAWSGSAKTMRGRSAPLIVADEVDGYEATEEGHPVSLLWQRAATFSDRKLMEISTPTVKGISYIEKAFDSGDKRRFHVTCPDCGHLQTLQWDFVRWDGRVSTGLDDAHLDLHEDHAPSTAHYTCSECGSLWNDGQRIAAIRLAEANGGGWKAEKPFRGHASYHLNELYSTFRRLKDIVQSYIDKLATDDLQTFVNVSLAETFEEKGEQADPDGMMARAEEYQAPVPYGGLVLTAGVDMQADRLECEIVAWGHGEESWSIDYLVLWGDPLQGDVWEELEEVLSSTWLHESGAQMSITSACVDTGGNGGTTQAAYDWLRGKTGRRIFGIKGVSGWGRPIVEAPKRKQSGKTARKIDLFLVGVDEAKLTVMRRLGVATHGPGYCHVPKERGSDWYQQITAEKLITRYSKGFPVREWYQTRPRNEALDCRVYALAALKISNPSFKRASERLVLGQNKQKPVQNTTELADEKLPTLAKSDDPKQTIVIKRSSSLRKKGGWVSNW